MELKTRTPAAGADLKLRKGQDRTRDDNQKFVDGELGKAVAAYQKAGGGVVDVLKRPRVAFAAAPDDRNDVKSMIRRAANLHKVAAIFFEDTTDDGTGETVITVTVGPKPPKKTTA